MSVKYDLLEEQSSSNTYFFRFWFAFHVMKQFLQQYSNYSMALNRNAVWPKKSSDYKNKKTGFLVFPTKNKQTQLHHIASGFSLNNNTFKVFCNTILIQIPKRTYT